MESFLKSDDSIVPTIDLSNWAGTMLQSFMAGCQDDEYRQVNATNSFIIGNNVVIHNTIWIKLLVCPLDRNGFVLLIENKIDVI